MPIFAVMNRIKQLFSLALLLIISYFSSAEPYVFQYTNGCRLAYNQYMGLHLAEGNATIRQEIIKNPYNLMATYLADYEDCLLLLFNGNKADFNQRKAHMDERLELLNNSDDSTPWYRLSKAGVYLHWAMAYLRFGENLKAANLFRKSFALARANEEQFPQFAQNDIFLGLQEAIIGTIPEDYKWLASLFGMKGNVKKGTARLTSFINNSKEDEPLRNEAIIYHAYIRFYLLSQQQQVWAFVNNSSQFPTQGNLLHAFVKANIGVNFRKAEAALEVLRSAENTAGYKLFPIMDYEMGTALALKTDPDAITYFSRFLKRYNGSFFIKDTWQQMALSYYMQGNIPKANYCRAQIPRYGTSSTDADKQAKRFSETASWPALPVLQARMLIDGGYYEQALQKLQGCTANVLPNITDKLEYYFRYGRVLDEMNNDTKALQYYQTTINLGKGRKEHFAARAALQMGFIYERAGNIQEAVKCYQECLAMRNHDYQNNLDQQAKAGIDRLSQR